jgi:hypothetical protein
MNMFKRFFRWLFGSPAKPIADKKFEAVPIVSRKEAVDAIMGAPFKPEKPWTPNPAKKIFERRAKVKAGYFVPNDLRQGNSIKLSMGWIEGWKPVQKRSGKHRSQERRIAQ